MQNNTIEFLDLISLLSSRNIIYPIEFYFFNTLSGTQL